MSWWELVGYLTGVASVWLYAVRSVWAWPMAALTSTCWIALFWSAGLPVAAALQLAAVGLAAVGGLVWSRGVPAPTRIAPAEVLLLSLGTGMAGTAAWMMEPAAVPGVVALAVTYLFIRQRLAAWWWWIVVDLLSVWIYADHGFYVSALVQPFFVGLCVVGWRRWRMTRRRPPATPDAPRRVTAAAH